MLLDSAIWRIKSWGNSTWTSSLTLAPSILSPLTTTCNSWVFWPIDGKERKKPAPLQYWLTYLRKKEDLLLPNLDGLLRGLLGGAVGLQGLDDRELPGVPSPVLVQSMVKRWWRNNCLVFYLENPFTSDADPCPGLRHFVQLLLKGGKLWLRLIWDFLMGRICCWRGKYFLTFYFWFSRTYVYLGNALICNRWIKRDSNTKHLLLIMMWQKCYWISNTGCIIA